MAECARLKAENERLRSILSPSSSPVSPPAGKPGFLTATSSSDEKAAFFMGLFQGRQDVFAVRWESAKGKSGYSPVCTNEWDRALCGKPLVHCGECSNRDLQPLTQEVILGHLTGRKTIGVYPLLPDETCRFLVLDFDKQGWKEDAGAFLKTCGEQTVPAALERSRSGNGGHVWIFFSSPIPARTTRKLGSALLTRTMERRYQVGLDSYDRLFPNQDTIPKGGFGNLIALPLQKGPREKGHSLFLDSEFIPFEDQWSFLSQVRRMLPEEVERIVRQAETENQILGVRASQTEEVDDPWTLPPSGRMPSKPLKGPFPKRVELVLGNMVFVEKAGLPPGLLDAIQRVAAFQNPEFYKAQAMRLSTFDKPRIISCAEDLPRHLALPRGCIDDLKALLAASGIKVDLRDERFAGDTLPVTFQGELRPAQQAALDEVLPWDIGVLSAGTAFGKTVMGARIIAERKVNTLILVHRKPLMDQWRQRLEMFLDLSILSGDGRAPAIGLIGGGKARRTGRLDIAMIQSLVRKGEVKDLVAEYGQIIVDECHHVSAFSFEQVMKKAKARFVLGLTATPIRKDGHHPIIVMQCGPLRYRANPRKEAEQHPFEHTVIPRSTDFVLPGQGAQFGIQDIYGHLAGDPARNQLIFDDVLECLEVKRSPLILTERAGHVDLLAAMFKGFARNIIVLKGGMGRKQVRKVGEELAAIPEGEERIIIATGRYLGEGFDDNRLDTLFLAMPISWRGTLQQYAGRLHRLHDDKKEVRIFDYVDDKVPVLRKMFERRLKGYHSIGYVVEGGGHINMPVRKKIT